MDARNGFGGTLTGLDLRAGIERLRKERNAAIEQRENATKAFYASLNPAQQKAFDVAMPAHGHGKGHGMHRGGPRGEGHPGMGGDRPAFLSSSVLAVGWP